MDGYFIGLMTGSSADAIDAALVRFDHGKPTLVHTNTTPYPATLRQQIIDITHGKLIAVADICRLDSKIGEQLAHSAEDLINNAGIDREQIRAIGSHGQTVCHLPNETPRGTLQLGDASQITELTGITTVADFRHRDMAAGGQGAPFAPAFHNACLRSTLENRCVLNLGGIANITVLPADINQPVIGFDTGPANALVDLWAEKHFGKRFDENGDIAAQGVVNGALLQQLQSDPFFTHPPPKSTGVITLMKSG